MLFRSMLSFKNMMKPCPPKITSKLTISYNLILDQLSKNKDTDKIVDYSSSSLFGRELISGINGLEQKSECLKKEYSNRKLVIQTHKVPTSSMTEYIVNMNFLNSGMSKNKEKNYKKKIATLENSYPDIKKEYQYQEDTKKIQSEIVKVMNDIENDKAYILNDISDKLNILKEDGYVREDNNLTSTGEKVQMIHEVPGLVFSKLIEDKFFEPIDTTNIICLFSIFLNISTTHDCEYPYEDSENLYTIYNMLRYWGLDEKSYHTNDITKYIKQWIKAGTEEECKTVLNNLKNEREISAGEFSKGMLKIVSIAKEFESVGEISFDLDLVEKMKKIPELLLKHVIINLSLYV